MQKNNFGFTLIEVLVAIGTFSLIMGGAIGMFTVGLKAQRDIRAQQELVEHGSFLAEYMSRAMRGARKDLGSVFGEASCLTMKTDPGLDREVTTGDPTGLQRGWTYQVMRLTTFPTTIWIRFIDRNDKCREFRWEGGPTRVIERVSTNNYSGDFGSDQLLTPTDISIVEFETKIAGSYQGTDAPNDRVQPRVTLYMSFYHNSAPSVPLPLQFTVTSRDLDVIE